MTAIPLQEALERLARAIEGAAPEDITEIYAELFPSKPLPDVTGTRAAVLSVQLAKHVRAGIEPEEVVDLWNVVFPAARDVSYDEEDRTLLQNERALG